MSDEKIIEHYGMCDASAAVAVSNDLFIVASDEDNVLRVYRAKISGKPIQEIDATPWLQLEADHPEVDFEAAARVDDVIYWISSHGTNKDGAARPNRRRFFATKFRLENERVILEPMGNPYQHLVEDFSETASLKKYNLLAASVIAPKAPGGLCIEALSATPEGKLWIGFRNPLAGDRALLVFLENPQAMLQGERACFGNPMELDLGGLGFRSLEYFEAQQRYLIVAGDYDSGDKFRLYEWSGRENAKPERIKIKELHGLRPEALLTYPHKKKKVQLLSDDGARAIDDEACKETASTHRYFRSMWIEP